MYIWDNQKLPILQLGDAFYDVVAPADFQNPQLRYWNENLNINVPKEYLSHLKPIPDNLPQALALKYHGHQFQVYNPHLGDGRGFLFAQIISNNQWYDLGTKGSGRTPYSRSGDGRLTLKGAYREALATEMLESLGVKTSRTLCFFETDEKLERNDEPSPTRSAVLTRYSLGHIRIGTFQRLMYFKEPENINKLVSYCLNFYYATDCKNLDFNSPEKCSEQFLKLVTDAIAKLAAQVMMAGFVHGVLNTDNINISGELFDYGPYRFMPEYNPEFTAAYFDNQGLYCFGRQPVSFLWALEQLATSLKYACPNLPAVDILNTFSDSFNDYVKLFFLGRLNLTSRNSEKTSHFLDLFFATMQENNIKFEEMFYYFHSKNILSLNNNFSKKINSGLLKVLDYFDVKNAELATNIYFNSGKPCTLLIDEIETIWSHIDKENDWSLFENKIKEIRSFRGLY